MRYREEWLKKEAADELDELRHCNPEQEYQFYQAVATGDVDAVPVSQCTWLRPKWGLALLCC